MTTTAPPQPISPADRAHSRLAAELCDCPDLTQAARCFAFWNKCPLRLGPGATAAAGVHDVAFWTEQLVRDHFQLHCKAPRILRARVLRSQRASRAGQRWRGPWRCGRRQPPRSARVPWAGHAHPRRLRRAADSAEWVQSQRAFLAAGAHETVRQGLQAAHVTCRRRVCMSPTRLLQFLPARATPAPHAWPGLTRRLRFQCAGWQRCKAAIKPGHEKRLSFAVRRSTAALRAARALAPRARRQRANACDSNARVSAIRVRESS